MISIRKLFFENVVDVAGGGTMVDDVSTDKGQDKFAAGFQRHKKWPKKEAVPVLFHVFGVFFHCYHLLLGGIKLRLFHCF